MSSASIRDALRGARLALSAVQAGWEEGIRQKQQREGAGVPLLPTFVLSLERMQRTVVGQQIAVSELERFADLRSELAVSMRRHWTESTKGVKGYGPEWLTAQIAKDLGL